MNTNVKSATSLIAVAFLGAIVFGTARADTLEQARSSVMDASQSVAASPIACSIAGESQDSGLGELPSTYTAAEFQHVVTLVAGAKQDSGLGELPTTYTAAEFQHAVTLVAGAKQDSGLGELPTTYTAAEFQRSAMLVTGAKRNSSSGQTNR